MTRNRSFFVLLGFRPREMMAGLRARERRNSMIVRFMEDGDDVRTATLRVLAERKMRPPEPEPQGHPPMRVYAFEKPAKPECIEEWRWD